MLWVVVNLQQLVAVAASVQTAVCSQANARSVHLHTHSLQIPMGHASTNRIVQIVKMVIAIISMVLVLFALLGMPYVLDFANLNRTALLIVPNVTMELVRVWLALLDFGRVQLVCVFKHRAAQGTAVIVTSALASVQHVIQDSP